MECPKCAWEKIEAIFTTYPKSYECERCGYIFVKSPPAMIDEQ